MERITAFCASQQIEDCGAFVEELIASPTEDMMDILDHLIFSRETIVRYFRQNKGALPALDQITNDNFTRVYLNRCLHNAPIDATELNANECFLLMKCLPNENVPYLEEILANGDPFTIAEVALRFKNELLLSSFPVVWGSAQPTEMPEENARHYDVLEAAYLSVSEIAAFPVKASAREVFFILCKVMQPSAAYTCLSKLRFGDKVCADAQLVHTLTEEAELQMEAGDCDIGYILVNICSDLEISDNTLLLLVKIASFLCPIAGGESYDALTQRFEPLPARKNGLSSDHNTLNELYIILELLFSRREFSLFALAHCSAQLIMYLAQEKFCVFDFAGVLAQRAMRCGPFFVSECLQIVKNCPNDFPLEVVVVLYEFSIILSRNVLGRSLMCETVNSAFECDLSVLHEEMLQKCNIDLSIACSALANELQQPLVELPAKAFVSFLLDFKFPLEHSVLLIGNSFTDRTMLQHNRRVIQLLLERFATEPQIAVVKRIFGLIIKVLHRYGPAITDFLVSPSDQMYCSVGLLAHAWGKLLSGITLAFSSERSFLQKLSSKQAALSTDGFSGLPQSENHDEHNPAIQNLPQENAPETIKDIQAEQTIIDENGEMIGEMIKQAEASIEDLVAMSCELLDCNEIKSRHYLRETILEVVQQFRHISIETTALRSKYLKVRYNPILFDVDDRLLEVLNRIVSQTAYKSGKEVKDHENVPKTAILRHIFFNFILDNVNDVQWEFLKGVTGDTDWQLAETFAELCILPLLGVMYVQNMSLGFELQNHSESISVNAGSFYAIQRSRFIAVSCFILERLSEGSQCLKELPDILLRIAYFQADTLRGFGLPMTVQYAFSIAEASQCIGSALAPALHTIHLLFKRLVAMPSVEMKEQHLAELAFSELPALGGEVQFDERLLGLQVLNHSFVMSQILELTKKRAEAVRSLYKKQLHVKADAEFADSFFLSYGEESKTWQTQVAFKTALPNRYSYWLFAALLLKNLCVSAAQHGKETSERMISASHAFFKELESGFFDNWHDDGQLLPGGQLCVE